MTLILEKTLANINASVALALIFAIIYFRNRLVYIIISSSLFESSAGKGFPTTFFHLYQIPVYSSYSNKTFYHISLSSSLSVCFLQTSLGCHYTTVTVHLLSVCHMTGHLHVNFSFNYGQDVFNFGLLPNP